MDPKPNETPLLTKILRRFKAQCNKNKRYMKHAPADGITEGQNKIENVAGDIQASSPCGCHCVSSCHKNQDEKHSSDSNTLVYSRLPLSKSDVECKFSYPATFCPNSLGMLEGYSSLCEFLDHFHRSCHSTPTPTNPCKRDSQIQTDPLPSLPPLCFQEQILLINNNSSPGQTHIPYSLHMPDKQSPILRETTLRESFDHTSSYGYSSYSFDRKTSASRTQSDPSLQKDSPVSPGMGSFRFDYRRRTSSCLLVSPDGSVSSQTTEYQHNMVNPDRKTSNQESFPTSTTFVSRPSRTQSQSTPTHENHQEDFVSSAHRRRSLSDSYAFEAFRGGKRVEKLRKMRRFGSNGKGGGSSLGSTFPYREEKLKIMNVCEDRSKKTAFSTFFDKIPKLSLLKRFKEKPLQYDSVPDLSKYENPRTPRKLKSICRNVRSHEQLDQAGMRHRRACSVSSTKTQRSTPEHSDCVYIDPDTVSRNFSKNNSFNLTKSARKTMSINPIDTKVRNIPGGSADTTPFHRNALHSNAPRSCNPADVGVQDSDEFYMTFDPDLNPPCPQSTAMMHAQSPVKSSVSYGTLPKNWRQIRQIDGITSDNMNWEQNGKESRYERLGKNKEDTIDHTTTPKSRSSTISPRHLWIQRSTINQDNRKYMPLPPLPTENTKQDIYQEIPGDAVFTSAKTPSPPCTPVPLHHPSSFDYINTYSHRDVFPYPEDMYNGVYSQSKSRFGPLTHSSSSLPGDLTSPSRSPGRGNIFISEGFLAKKLPMVSENGMRRRPDYINVRPADMSEDGLSAMEMGSRSPPLYMAHRSLKHTLSVPNRPLRQSKYQGYHSTSPAEEKKWDVREEVCRGKIKIPPIFLQQ